MGIFSNLFKKTKNQNNSFPTEYKSILEFNNEFKILLSQDQYIARSDYAYLIDKYHDTFLFYDNNRKANTLVYYCKSNKLNNITVNGELNKEADTNIGVMKKCLVCGYPLQLRYKKNYGLKLWMCSNEPEICSFITNEISGGELSIQKCDCCKDGYLIVKKTAKNEFMLGCTNYKSDGTGCNRTMTVDYYKRWSSELFEDDLSIDKPSYRKDIEIEVPHIKPSKSTPIVAERKQAEVHSTTYSKIVLGKDEFYIVTDDDGNEITNMELLTELRALRFDIAKEKSIAPYKIINNKVLVGLATYRPTTKEEFITLYGLGEITYSEYGARFIKAIKDYDKRRK